LAVSKLLVNETFPKQRQIAETGFPKAFRRA
jgi:hypothetical protein